MQLDAVEAGGLGVLSSLAELLHDAGNLVGGQRTWRGNLHPAILREGFAFDRQRRRRNRQLAAVEIRMRDPPDMPELSKDRPARRMHRVGHSLPACDLLG